ncbi:MAG: PadR family transcriptional regulator [Candidatus Heimdallarchaeum endolithica]|uniref:PadR family transcriptional regulator n=1 Tax=Candidatus Heimdallarchaeum endolithica TaxID=2876572 RepID=A0A9Y1BQR0_9ARCH|nr:MAG: PadR family transcriptional regulator [Candidatus Heimdallarchaeum endolithica]
MSFIFSPNDMIDSFILMNLTLKGPLHGYAIASIFEEKFDWKPSLTTIYNILKKMELAGIVSATEKIESGRVQKLYSITDKGKDFFEEHKKKMKKRMRETFSQFFTLFQDVEKLERPEEAQISTDKIKDTLNLLRKNSMLVMVLMRKSPEKVQKILKNSLTSLMELAQKENVPIPFENNSVS